MRNRLTRSKNAYDYFEKLAQKSSYPENFGQRLMRRGNARKAPTTPKRNLRMGDSRTRTAVVTLAALAGVPERGRGGGGGPARRGGPGASRGVGPEHGGEEAAGAGDEAREPPARRGRRGRRRRGGASGRRRVRVAARGGRLHGRAGERGRAEGEERGSGGKMGNKNGNPKTNRAGGFGVARWSLGWAVRF